jgi:L-alanine-DL-glutamate epimerase-like enolase superfamily enzyme
MMANEKPGGHGERSVAVGTLDMAIWDAVAKIAGKPLFRLLAERHGREANRVFSCTLPAAITIPARISMHSGERCVVISIAAIRSSK